MKTIKLFLSIALVGVTAISFGRISESSKEWTRNAAEVTFEHEVILEDWMTEAFKCSQLENELVMENWMTEAFKSSQLGNEPVLEDWMTVAFKSSQLENEPVMENWMSLPFADVVHKEVISLERWMAIPFETTQDIMEPEQGVAAVCN